MKELAKKLLCNIINFKSYILQFEDLPYAHVIAHRDSMTLSTAQILGGEIISFRTRAEKDENHHFHKLVMWFLVRFSIRKYGRQLRDPSLFTKILKSKIFSNYEKMQFGAFANYTQVKIAILKTEF